MNCSAGHDQYVEPLGSENFYSVLPIPCMDMIPSLDYGRRQ